ncbi:hypothetical protein [Floridanema flaviceps]
MGTGSIAIDTPLAIPQTRKKSLNCVDALPGLHLSHIIDSTFTADLQSF